MTRKILFFCLLFFAAHSLQAQVQTQKVSESDVKAVATTKAEKYAEITFDTLSYNFGTFSKNEPIRTCSFAFKNTGTAPLVIEQVFASCGCTVPEWPKQPIKPGETAAIDVRYDGTDKPTGQFQKTITVRANVEGKLVRLTIEGVME